MRGFRVAVVVVALCTDSGFVDATTDYGVFTPKKLALGTAPAMGASDYASGFTLTAAEPIATLDYGYEVAGLPYFVVSAVSSGPVDVEVKYSEQFSVLSTNFSDGPSQYATAVANSRRVETHRITLDEINATVTSMLSQPGQRWQTLRLLSGDFVTFEAVGFQASIEVIDDLSTLPGTFSSSNTKYNEIWNLGARAVSAACLDAGSQISSWSASEENGTFVPGTRPGVSYKSWNLSDYTLEFETRIIRGGVGFYIGYDITANRGSLMFHLSSEYPANSTYVNTNTTLFPANSVTLTYGFDFVNTTDMTSYPMGNYEVPFNVKEHVWYPAKLAVNSTAGNLVLWLDGHQVLDVTIAAFGYSDSQLTLNGYSTTGKGAIGFGGWQDQASFIRNVTATSLNDSTNVLYSNPMADESVVLPEFGVQSNTYGACLDGAKRDRYIWLGDFYHTTRIMGVANSKAEQITGTWEYLFNYQGPNGQYPGLMVMTYETPMPTPEVFMFDAGTANAYLNFPDYDILGFIGFVSYMEYFNDVDFARANWGSLKNATSWLASCQESDGLIDVNKYVEVYVFLGSSAGTAVNAAAVQSLEGMAKVAEAVGDGDSASQWADVAASVKTAINELLWNDTLGNYAVDVSTPEVYGVSATAFAITSGVANETQIKLCVQSLEGLRQGPGYLDTSDTDNATKISPNTNGFLLDALLQTGHADEAAFLLDNLWDAMISDESYRSGASWEYVSQSLEPGLEEFTSLSHPWGGAPTYALTNYVAGIRPVEFGFRRWIVNPLVMGLDITSANATVSTPHGSITAAWERDDTQLRVSITAPIGTEGVFQVAHLNSSTYRQSLNGTGEPISFTVQL
ncbi:Glycoside hydrolase [Phytophthora cinnamomi]|uniref:Glycoside hydrolase n=1 Tax=Phytophthora cinnamomi TaxID=4785 RepID=UPI00355992CD|nr:Glycoside hydrolase [Phytophthora cinnamomi]